MKWREWANSFPGSSDLATPGVMAAAELKLASSRHANQFSEANLRTRTRVAMVSALFNIPMSRSHRFLEWP
ncbi:MAG: hypothetical protein ACREJN_04175 [Nitrospiraceae bacterium]